MDALTQAKTGVEVERLIGEALAKGPTAGTWGFAHCTDTHGIATVVTSGLFVVGPDYKTPEMADYSEHAGCDVDAAYIAACNPENIRQLLASLAAERAEAVRVREAIKGAIELAKDAHAHWDADRDAKVGKLVMALAGFNPRYDARADALHAALSPSQGETN